MIFNPNSSGNKQSNIKQVQTVNDLPELSNRTVGQTYYIIDENALYIDTKLKNGTLSREVLISSDEENANVLYTKQKLLKNEKLQVKKNLDLYHRDEELIASASLEDLQFTNYDWPDEPGFYFYDIDMDTDWISSNSSIRLELTVDEGSCMTNEDFVMSTSFHGFPYIYGSYDLDFCICVGYKYVTVPAHNYPNITPINGIEILMSTNIINPNAKNVTLKVYRVFSSNYIDSKYITGLVGKKFINGGERFNYEGNIAAGNYSHAEGSYTKALGHVSHAEGDSTIASGSYAHAEGENTIASGRTSHAEGYGTQAKGYYSHAEGEGTIASGDYSHVEGVYNIEDNEEKYIHIIGNGENNNLRSNAYALDWSGNGYFSSDVYVKTNKKGEGIKLTPCYMTKIVLDKNKWTNLSQTINLYGILADEQKQVIHIDPIYNINYFNEIKRCNIKATAQVDNGIVFECEVQPTIDIEFYIKWQEIQWVANQLDLDIINSLIDFDYYYDINNDTYELTGWKGTLNGVSSYTMKFPDNEKIIF